jgi:hypothetical protein
MIVQESVIIASDKNKVWEIYSNIGKWDAWNSVCRVAVLSDGQRFAEGERFRLCIRPYLFKICFEPVVEQVVEHTRIVWEASKYGITVRHEFFLWPRAEKVMVTSRETFTASSRLVLRLLFPRKKVRKLVRTLLEDLKRAAES